MSESTLERDGSPEAGETEVIVGATGQELREHREALGASLSDVSDMLRIRYDFLEALESGHYDALPGEAYAVGFVRSYAKYLGLDADAMARQFKVELTGERPTARLDFLTPAAESRVPTAAIVFVAILLAIAIYGLWYFLNAREVSVSDVVPEIPAHLAGTAPTAQPAAGTVAPEAAAPQAGPVKQGQGATPPVAAATAPAGAGAPASQSPQAAAAPATPMGSTAPAPNAGAKPSAKPAAAPETKPAAPESSSLPAGPAPEPQAAASRTVAAAQAGASGPPVPAPVPPARPSQVQDQRLASAAPPQPAAPPTRQTEKLALSRIVLRATADSWVEVRTASGDLVISRVLTQGTTYSVPPRPGLRLTTGNAGGLEILVDGQELPSLGGSGKVRRDIALDPDRLKRRLAGRSR